MPLPTEARNAVRRYLNVRPPCESPRLLLGKGGRPLGTDGLRYVVRKYGVVTGLRLHPHALRHTFATEFLSANANDLVSLSQVLGHSAVDTSARYTHRTFEDLSNCLEAVHL